MSTVFYEVYSLLCRNAGKSDNAVAAEIGLSNSTVTTWKQGALPRRPTLKKVADYFNVSTDYLMGTAIDAQIDIIENKLRHMRAVLDFAENPEQEEEAEKQIEILEESYKALCLAKGLEKKTPTPGGERAVSDKEIMFALWGDTTDVDESDLEDVKRYAAFIRERKKKS